MKWIVITSPDDVPDEATVMARLADAGVDIIHLRKPGMRIETYESIIRRLSPALRDRTVIHEHFSLCAAYGLRGIHLNSRNRDIPPGHKGSVSCSCHSIEETARRKADTDYVFLSPIFDSISKQGYTAAFGDNDLEKARRQGIIDTKVMALGGVTADGIPVLRRYGFGGAAFLGDIWSRAGDAAFADYLKIIKERLAD